MKLTVPKARPGNRRREQTRQRLLDAALDVFAEEGFGRATVEQVCERAGFTRGAFYSNFTSLDELFLAMWEQKSQALVDGLRTTIAAAGVPDELGSVREAVELILPAIPVDDAWYRITAEFTAHALRNPSLRRVVAAREETILQALLPMLVGVLGRARRTVVDPPTLGRALVAVHDGTSIQCLLEPDDPAAWRRRTDLFVAVIEQHTKENPHE